MSDNKKMIDYDKMMDAARAAEQKRDRITSALKKLKLATVALQELDTLKDSDAPIMIFLKDSALEERGMRIDELFPAEELRVYVQNVVQDVANKSYYDLNSINRAEQEFIPVSEDPIVPVVECETDEKAKMHQINSKLVEDLYFRQGKKVAEIVEETGYGKSSVYKCIEKFKEAKAAAAKECVRQR